MSVLVLLLYKFSKVGDKMNEYEVNNYGIFSDAVSTTKNLNNSLNTASTELASLKTQLSNGNIFMGPICDSCIEAFATVDSKINNLTVNYGTIEAYLIETYHYGNNSIADGRRYGSNGIRSSTADNHFFSKCETFFPHE